MSDPSCATNGTWDSEDDPAPAGGDPVRDRLVAVLGEHRRTVVDFSDGWVVRCVCGQIIRKGSPIVGDGAVAADNEDHAAHVASQLAPLLADERTAAAREAWETGYLACQDGAHQQDDNPYRALGADDAR